MDYGAEAGLATRELLDEAGIRWFGAGYAGSEGNPAILEKNGISLACLGYTHPPCEESYSTAECFGSARYSRPDFEGLVADLEKRVDHILVFMHWGLEEINYPVPENLKTAHEIIDLGADAVIGSHPHVYQGYEIYNGKYIFYSLGNFIFGNILAKTVGDQIYKEKRSWRNRNGLTPVFSIDKNSINLAELNFFHFRKDNTIVKLTGLSARLHSLCVGRLSSPLELSPDHYAQWWRRNIKFLVFLKLLEQAAVKGLDFRPGMRHLGMLKRLITRDADTFG
jgi:hypothetical protein